MKPASSNITSLFDRETKAAPSAIFSIQKIFRTSSTGRGLVLVTTNEKETRKTKLNYN
jgi:hypothetical protein